jgi:hypothetical protein
MAIDTQLDLRQIESEILRGCPHETKRIDMARKNIEVYHGTYEDQEMQYFDRDHRARRDLPLMAKVIEALTAYPYQDAPTRHIADHKDATDFLGKVYEQNRMTTLLRASDRYRHAADIFALQVHATGDQDKPLKFFSWTADSLVVWTDSEDQTIPIAVCLIDRFDNQTRYRLWTSNELRTYMTKKWNGETAGGRVPTLVSVEPNPYGVLPFVFFHALPPITQFIEGGPGDTLSRMERHINFRLMEDADHLRFSKPRGFLLGVEADKDLIHRPRAGEWDRFGPNPPKDARDNFGSNPDVKWIAPPMDWLDKEWDDLKYYWNWALETVGVPAASIPLDKAIIATVSGAALIARNIPLFLYAKKTQEQYRYYEQDLAKLVFTITSKVYGLFGDAIEKPLAITWGEVVPDMPPDSPDDYLDGLADRGELSQIQVIMKRMGFTREQAIEHLEQIAKDEAEMAKIRAKYGDHQPDTTPPLAHDTGQSTHQNEEV